MFTHSNTTCEHVTCACDSHMTFSSGVINLGAVNTANTASTPTDVTPTGHTPLTPDATHNGERPERMREWLVRWVHEFPSAAKAAMVAGAGCMCFDLKARSMLATACCPWDRIYIPSCDIVFTFKKTTPVHLFHFWDPFSHRECRHCYQLITYMPAPVGLVACKSNKASSHNTSSSVNTAMISRYHKSWNSFIHISASCLHRFSPYACNYWYVPLYMRMN